jgi:hypothetical protein
MPLPHQIDAASASSGGLKQPDYMTSLKATGKLGIPGPETNGQKADKSNFLGRSGMLFYGKCLVVLLSAATGIENNQALGVYERHHH